MEYTRYARVSHSRQWCYYNRVVDELCVYMLGVTNNMSNVRSVVLMLMLLVVLWVDSSVAIHCYVCSPPSSCDDAQTVHCDTHNVCLKADYEVAGSVLVSLPL